MLSGNVTALTRGFRRDDVVYNVHVSQRGIRVSQRGIRVSQRGIRVSQRGIRVSQRGIRVSQHACLHASSVHGAEFPPIVRAWRSFQICMLLYY